MKSAHRILRRSIAERLAATAFTAAALACLAPSTGLAVTAYTGASDNWGNPAFWSPNVVPSGAFNQRINFNGGTTVTYGAAQGTTSLGASIAADNRAFLLGFTTGTGTLNITGGILQANGTAGPTGVSLVSANVNGAVGVLNVSGGTLDLTTSDSATGRVLAIGTFSTAAAINLNGTVSVSGTGLLKVSDFRFNEVANTNTGATQITGVLNLNGGTMEVARIQEGSANVAQARTNSTVNFNGGLLKFTANNGGVLGSLDTVSVKSGGARIEVDAAVTGVTVAKPLLDGTGGGGFIKTGTGNLSLNSAGNTYTGSTEVNGGTLTLAAASTFATSAFNVNSTGTLVSNATGLTNLINVNNGGVATLASSTSGQITVNTGGTLRGEGSSTGNVVFGAGSSLVFDPNTVAANQYFRTTANINTTAGAGTKINLNLTAATTNTGVVVFEGGSITTNGLSDFKLNTRGTLSLTATQLLFDFGAGSVVWKGGNVTNPTFWDVNTTAQNFTLAGVDDFFLGADNVTFDNTASNFNPTVQAALVAGAVTFDNSLANPYILSGAGVTATSLAKLGAGKVTIGNANTIASVTIDAGEVQIGDGIAGTASLGAANVTNNATLSYDFGAVDALRGNNVSGAGAIVKNGAGKLTLNGAITATGTTTVNAGTLGFSPTAAANLDTTIGGAGSVEKSGNQVLTIDTANTYAGTTTIAASGSLVLTGAGTLGSTAGGTTVASGGSLGLRDGVTIPAGETITISGTGVAAQNHFFPGAIGQRGAIQAASGAGNVVASPVIFTTNNTRIGVQEGASLELAGAITEATPGLALIFRGGTNAAGTILLSGAGNSWTGQTDIYGSAVKLGVNNALPAASLLRIGVAAVGISKLDMNGFSTTVAGLGTAGGLGSDAVITNDGAADSTLTLNPLANQSFPGTIQNGATNNIGVVKAGSFTQTLTGANTYTGLTTISGGQLEITGTHASLISVNAAGTLGGEGATTGDVIFNAGSSFSFNPATVGVTEHFRSTSAIDTTAGATTKININLSTPVTSGTGIVVFEGGSIITANGVSDFKLNSRGSLSLTATQLLFDYAAGSVLWKGGNGINPTFWDVNTTTQNVTVGGVDDVFFQTDDILFNDTALNRNPTVQAALTAGAVTFDNALANPYTLSGAGVTATSLTKTGTGKVTVSNAITVSGGTTISAGTVQLGDGTAATGSISGTIVNDGELVTNFGANNATLAGSISGTGSLTQAGTGTVTLTGFNSYGATIINSGATLQVGNNGAIGSLGLGDTTNNGTLIFNRSTAESYAGAISGSGAVIKSAAGALTLSGANSYDGITTVNAGGTTSALILQNATALGSTVGGTTVASNARVELDNVSVIGEAITVAGTGGNLIGALQSRSGISAWSGPITIADTSVRVGAQPGASLTLSGAIGDGGNNLGIIFRPQDASASVIVTGANTYTGATSIVGGPVSATTLNSVVGGTATSSFGAPTTVTTGTITLGLTTTGGILVYTGAGETTDRVINLGNATDAISGNGIDQSGTGLLKFTSNFTATGNGAKTLTLRGSTTGAGEIAGAIVNSTGATALTKSGTGTWTLSGANTYTGVTNVNEGVLNVTGTLGTGANVVNANGGTTNFGASQTFAVLNIADGAVVTVGSVGPAPAPEFDGGFAGAEAFVTSPAAVPEPGSAALLFGGMLTLLGVRRRQCGR